MIWLNVLLATLMAGVGSVWVAAWLTYVMLDRITSQLLSLAAGALLATALLQILPEVAHSGVFSIEGLFIGLLLGLLSFFFLDKVELWHHGHEHHHDHDHDHGHGHGHEHHHTHLGRSTWAIVTADGLHAFGDGVLIAAAFAANGILGWVAALSVLAHEVPHHMGDLVVLHRGLGNRRAALFKVSLAGSMTALGGISGYFLINEIHQWIPYLLLAAASSFIYVALADLIPQLQKRLHLKDTFLQIFWLLLGIGLVAFTTLVLHDGHDHHPERHQVHDHE